MFSSFNKIILCLNFCLFALGCSQSSESGKFADEQINQLLDEMSQPDLHDSALAVQELRRVGQRSPEGYENMAAVMLKRIQADPSDLKTAALLKDIYMRQLDDPNAAVDLYRQLVISHPGDLSLKNELVGLYRASKRYEDVAQLYREEIGTGRGDDDWYRFQVASYLIYAGGNA